MSTRRVATIALTVLGLTLLSSLSRSFATISIVVELSENVTPPTVQDSLWFDIASLDSIGLTHNIVRLESLFPSPVDSMDRWPHASRIYVSFFPDSVDTGLVVDGYLNDIHVTCAAVDTFTVEMFSLPGDELFQNQWGLRNTGDGGQPNGDGVTDIDALEAWEFTTGSSSVVIGEIDLEIWQDHPDIAPNLWNNPSPNPLWGDTHGRDFENGGSTTVEGAASHGTPIGGILVGSRDDETGVVGVAYDCRLMTIRAASARNIINAFTYAGQRGVRVISCSLKLPEMCSLYSVLDDCADHDDCVIVLASGNCAAAPTCALPCDGLSYHHAAFSFEIADGCTNGPYVNIEPVRLIVGNACSDGMRVKSSSFLPSNAAGQRLSCLAPGGGVCTLLGSGGECLPAYTDMVQDRWANNHNPDDADDYTFDFGGSSAATPHVAGIAALLFSDDPYLKGSEVKKVIEASCVDVTDDSVGGSELFGWDRYTGYGVANANRALIYPLIRKPVVEHSFDIGDTVTIVWKKPHSHSESVVNNIYYLVDGEQFLIDGPRAEDASPDSTMWVIPECIGAKPVRILVEATHELSETNDARYTVSDTSDVELHVNAPVVRGVVTSDTTWCGVLEVDGDVTIPTGVTVNVEPGTTISLSSSDALSSGSDTARNEIIINGRLSALGTEAKPIVFTSDAVSQDPGDWFGIRVASGGDCFVAHGVIEYARFGCYQNTGSDSLHISYTTIQLCETAGIYSSVGGSHIAHLTLLYSYILMNDSPYGVWAEGVDSVTVVGNTFDGDSTYGIYSNCTSTTGVQAYYQDNEFSDFTFGTAIFVFSQSPLLKNNTAVGCKWGITLAGSTSGASNSPTLVKTNTTANTLTDCTTALWSKGCVTPDVDSLVINSENYQVGVYCDSASAGSYSGLVVNGGDYGMKIWASSHPSVRNSSIVDFDLYGVYVNVNADIDLGTSGSHGLNSILSAGSPLKYIATKTPRNPGLGDVSAQYNWYGTSSPSSSLFGTHAIYSPYLSSAPSPSHISYLSKTPSIGSYDLRATENPFSEQVELTFGLPVSGRRVVIQVFDVSGRMVRVIADGPLEGTTIVWDGAKEGGERAAPGIYLVRAQVGSTVSVSKLLKLK